MSDQTQEQTGEITKIPIRLFCQEGQNAICFCQFLGIGKN